MASLKIPIVLGRNGSAAFALRFGSDAERWTWVLASMKRAAGHEAAR